MSGVETHRQTYLHQAKWQRERAGAGWRVYPVAFAIFIGIHLLGLVEALIVVFVIRATALVGRITFAVANTPDEKFAALDAADDDLR